MTKKIWDYFVDTIEYPKEIIDNPIPYGEAWTYVSNTFLNGFINYCTPIACYVVNRYTPETEDISDNKVYIRKHDDTKSNEFVGTKKELIDLFIQDKLDIYHTTLSCFSDDIVIIAKVEERESNKYIFFWFDMDVSDCSIGKFKTDDSQEQVIESVENWLTEEFKNNKEHEAEHTIESSGYFKLPLSFLSGWIKF